VVALLELGAIEVSDLRDHPEFLEVVAVGVWQEWWQEKGRTQTHILSRTEEALGGNVIPSVLVAHAGEVFLGSVALIAHDMKARPEYTPWLAALLVHPDHRDKGVASRLMVELEAFGKRHGIDKLYLCAVPALRSFYEAKGWSCFEEDVNGLDVFEKQL